MSSPAGQSISGPVRIISDLHMAHDGSEVKAVSMLRPLLEGVGKVVFNGDTCEQLYSAWSGRGEGMRAELVELCARLGVEAIFLRGNHDPRISDRGWLTACEGRILIAHGDMVLENPSPWSREYLARKEEVAGILRARGEGDGSLQYRWETLQILNEALVPHEVDSGRGRLTASVLNGVWPPERFYQILKVWLMMSANAEAFVNRFAPDCRAFLFGHFHRAAVMRRGGRFYCNTGAFMVGRKSLVVDLDKNELVVRKVVKDRTFQLGAEVTRHRV